MSNKTEHFKFCPKCPKDPKRPSKASLLFYNKENETVFCINCGFTVDFPLTVQCKENIRVVDEVSIDPEYNKEMIQKTMEETHKRNLDAMKKSVPI